MNDSRQSIRTQRIARWLFGLLLFVLASSTTVVASTNTSSSNRASPVAASQTANIWGVLHDGLLQFFFGSPTYPTNVPVEQPLATSTPSITPSPLPRTPSPTPTSPRLTAPAPTPTVVNNQVTVTQSLTPAQLTQIEQQVNSASQLQISSLQQSIANLTSQLNIVQSNTARLTQAPIESNPGIVQYPNAVSFTQATFSGPIIGTTANFSGAVTASQFNGNITFSGAPTFGAGASISGNLTVSGKTTLAGNVGIGTTNPVSTLDILGSVRSEGVDDTRFLSRSTDNAGGLSGLTAQSIAGTGGFQLVSPVVGATSNVTTVSNYDTYLSTRHANNLIFATNNIERVRIDGTSGNVGIGTTGPTQKLVVFGTAGNNDILNIASASGASALYVTKSGNVGIGTTAPNVQGSTGTVLTEYNGTLGNNSSLELVGNRNGALQSVGAVSFQNTQAAQASKIIADIIGQTGVGGDLHSGSLLFRTADNTGARSPRMEIDENGNVGIGSTSPTQKLVVVGTAGANDIFNVASASGTSALYVTKSGNVGIGTTNPTSTLTIQSAPGGATLLLNSTASAVAQIDLNATGGVSTIKQNAGRMEFRNGGVNPHIVIDVSGNVGIGTIAPRSKFMIVDTAAGGTAASSSFTIRASTTIGTVASISATSLTSGAVFSITVPASATFSGPIFVARDTNGVVLASLSSGGRFSIRRTMFSHGADTTNCTGIGAPVSGCIDYAENMPTSDSSITAGDIISISPDSLNVTKSLGKGDNAILGIVSTNPAALITGNDVKLGDEANSYQQAGFVPVALAGRVPVKTSLENGPIAPGDKLTASSVPGVAMKATQPGEIVGTALEPLDSIASGSYTPIMTFVNVGYWAPSMDSVLASSSLEPTVTIQSSWGSFSLATIFDFILAQFSKIGITFGNGGIHTAGSIQSDDSVKAQRLCAGNTCVDEAQLQQLLQNASGTFSPSPTPFTEPSPSPSPTPEPSATPTPDTSPSPTPEPTPAP